MRVLVSGFINGFILFVMLATTYFYKMLFAQVALPRKHLENVRTLSSNCKVSIPTEQTTLLYCFCCVFFNKMPRKSCLLESDESNVKPDNLVFIDLPEVELDENNKIIVPSYYEISEDGIANPLCVANEETVEELESDTTIPTSSVDSFSSAGSEESDPLEINPQCAKIEIQQETSHENLYKDYFGAKLSQKNLQDLCYQQKDSSPTEPKSRGRRKQIFPRTLEDEHSLSVTTPPKISNDNVQPPKDLMWLLNFKLDSYLKKNPLDGKPCKENHKSNLASNNSSVKAEAISDDNYYEVAEEEVQQENETNKKPPFTYTELIEHALIEKGPLTVSEIYHWISEMFPFYKKHDDRWKNSVRHNLSINPYFRKGGKAKQGSGHLWTVSESADTAKSLSAKRRRYQEFSEYRKRMKLEMKDDTKSLMDESMKRRQQMDEDAKEAAIAASIIYNIIEDKENQCDAPHGREIQQSAGDILSGVKRNVAVEYIDVRTLSGNDFLNPVSKEDVIGECGFLGQVELNMTAEPLESFDSVASDMTYEQLDDLGFQFNDMNCHHGPSLPLVN